MSRTSSTEAADQDLDAATLARGVTRALTCLGYASLTEFTLRNGRRVDVMALADSGTVTIVEIKSSLADFRADRKWRDYLAYCDRFYFAVPQTFPLTVLPEVCGLMVADGYDATILREAPVTALSAARRRAQTLRFAQTAAQRLVRLTDPNHDPGH